MVEFTCSVDERIWLGDQVAVTFLEVRSGQVRLGIDAPKEIEVHREEVYRRIKGCGNDMQKRGEDPSLLASNRRLFRRKRRIIHDPTPY